MRKPSTLCLSVHCQPDPAVVKKPKSTQNSIIEKQKPPKQVETIEFKSDNAHVEEVGLLNLDTMLNKYEEMFAEEINIKHPTKLESSRTIKSNIPISSNKVLKPRVKYTNYFL